MLRPIAIAKCPKTMGKYPSIYSRVTSPLGVPIPDLLIVPLSQVVPVFLSYMHESLACSSTLIDTAFDFSDCCSELSID